MRYLLNRHEDGWLMRDAEASRDIGLFDTEESAMEHAWFLTNNSGADAVVYSRDGLDDDSQIVITGLRRCPDCRAMRPHDDYNRDRGGLPVGHCRSCEEGPTEWLHLEVIDDASELLRR